MISRFITLPKLKEVAHVFDTQVNESLNNTISWLAPKNKCYGGSQSLGNRIAIAIGMNVLGTSQYFVRLFKALSIPMTPNVAHYLEVQQSNRKKRIDKCKTTESKKARNEDMFNKIRRDEQARKRDMKKGQAAMYLTGMYMMDEGCLEGDNGAVDEQDDGAAKPAPAKKAKTNHKDSLCPHCGRKGHVSKRSKQCLYHSGTPKQSDIPTAATAQEPPADNNDAAEDIDGYDRLPLQPDSVDTDDDEADVIRVGVQVATL